MKWNWIGGAFFAVIVVLYLLLNIANGKLTNEVILESKPWNNGYVHVWKTIIEERGVEALYTDIRDGARCQKLDNEEHPLVGDGPPIYYYHVDCNGVVGYVEVEQVR